MQRQSIFYLIVILFAIGLISCGGSDDSEETESDLTTKPTTQTPPSDDEGPAVKTIEVDFLAEEADIKRVFTEHADAVGEGQKALDKIMSYWLESNNEDVFTSWTFWAGAFEKNVGWDDIKNGWVGIFRLRSGKMTVDISSLSIDSKGKIATLRATYKWAVSGDLIAAMQKDEGEWKITAIDYTNARFGKQIKEITTPGYKNPA